MTTLSLGLGTVGAVLFVITFVVDGATRPGYDAVRHTVSDSAGAVVFLDLLTRADEGPTSPSVGPSSCSPRRGLTGPR